MVPVQGYEAAVWGDQCLPAVVCISPELAPHCNMPRVSHVRYILAVSHLQRVDLQLNVAGSHSERQDMIQNRHQIFCQAHVV